MKKANLAAAILAAGSMLGTGAAFASNDPAATGRLMLVTGNVQIQRNVQTDNAMIGGIVGVGDTILTTDTGTTQWKMSDDSMFAIAPESGFRINKYALPSSRNPEGVASYTLLQGAVHAITGKIGKSAAVNTPRGVYTVTEGHFTPANLIKVVAAPAAPFTLKTGAAAITAKGADFTAVQAGKILKVLVKAGSVTVCTIAGCATPAAGEGAVVACEGCKPAVAAAASLDIDSLVASLEFNLQVPAKVEDDQITDTRKQPLTPTQACRTVLARIEGSANCDGADGPGRPVSPH